MGLWFTCKDDNIACISMADVLSVAIDDGNSSVCKVTLHSQLVSFGDVTIDSSTSSVLLVLNGPAYASLLVDDLQTKLQSFKELGAFACMTGLNTSMQAIEDGYIDRLRSLGKGKDLVTKKAYARFKYWHKRIPYVVLLMVVKEMARVMARVIMMLIVVMSAIPSSRSRR
jgi:hypothetical protein